VRGQKPPSAPYPKKLRTLGDHLRKRRLDMGLRQRDVAGELEATVNTIMNWELGHSEPALRFIPGIVRFLGYDPVTKRAASWPLSGRLKTYRQARGLSQAKLAQILAVDESTVWHWEQGRSCPNEAHRARIEVLLATP
jgi:transcriptional regulator with XRE-family HTH domain